MSRKYNIMYFGHKKERIKLVHFPRPNKKGLAGLIQGGMFYGYIGILVDDSLSGTGAHLMLSIYSVGTMTGPARRYMCSPPPAAAILARPQRS